MHAGDGEDAGRAADIDQLAQHVRAVVLQRHHLPPAVERRIGLRRGDVALHADGIDAFLRPAPLGEVGVAERPRGAVAEGGLALRRPPGALRFIAFERQPPHAVSLVACGETMQEVAVKRARLK
jgi:hypothetical protein